MRKTAFLALLVVGLAGCATTAPSTYGNFTQSAPAAFNQTMADDAVKQLVAVYPPASTRFDLQHATPDAFGSSLVESLRAKGYALLEFKPAAQASGASAATDAAATAPATAGKPLRYILDQAESNLYRVTLLVGNQSLTRAYSAAQNGTLYPAGAWVRKE
jgi:type IV secretion system protein TrbH